MTTSNVNAVACSDKEFTTSGAVKRFLFFLCLCDIYTLYLLYSVTAFFLFSADAATDSYFQQADM